MSEEDRQKLVEDLCYTFGVATFEANMIIDLVLARYKGLPDPPLRRPLEDPLHGE